MYKHHKNVLVQVHVYASSSHSPLSNKWVTWYPLVVGCEILQILTQQDHSKCWNILVSGVHSIYNEAGCWSSSYATQGCVLINLWHDLL